jgi:hypothetical protein
MPIHKENKLIAGIAMNLSRNRFTKRDILTTFPIFTTITSQKTRPANTTEAKTTELSRMKILIKRLTKERLN